MGKTLKTPKPVGETSKPTKERSSPKPTLLTEDNSLSAMRERLPEVLEERDPNGLLSDEDVEQDQTVDLGEGNTLSEQDLGEQVPEIVEQVIPSRDPSELDNELHAQEKTVALDEDLKTFRKRLKHERSYEEHLEDESSFRETVVESPNTMQRLAVAAKAIEHINNEVFLYGAGNQKEDIVETKGVSRSRTKDSRTKSPFSQTKFGPGKYDLRDNRSMDEGADEARGTVKSKHWKAGVCDDYARVTMDYLRSRLPGETLNKVGLDKHAFIVIGDQKTEDPSSLVVADPWPTRPQACLWTDHFCYKPGDALTKATKVEREADGQEHKDVSSELAFGKKSSARFAKQSDRDLKTTVNEARKIDDVWFERTTTKDGKAVFYVDPSWNTEEKAEKKQEFKKTLLSSKHLPKKGKDKLHI